MRVYKDDLGLWRVRSLISNRIDTHDFRYPIILDSGHPIVEKLIEHTHKKLNHAQTSVVINNLREHFWILNCRHTTNAVIHKCIICKRYSAKRIELLPAVLPYDRVKEAAIFEVTGTDYAGSLFLRDDSKAWICLFTCAVYRAVHLELVISLSHSFLEAFRRFIARRGRSSIIYTDNGTNFTGANKSLRKINWKKIEDYGTVEKIHWNFNSPTAA
ncbi:PREDICTED: uncharacterized protein LOC108782469 [Cyphomyrmex costatus]|uniref:uncharacterized protein LOC108782469 n=1 Tax=Cyphomyrmex costatus TaxID=456900 RepID=UPI0008521E76|nr:PREDICTED: uncharacterized protein LOC108782469 [Cyphomyrmex costatus]